MILSLRGHEPESHLHSLSSLVGLEINTSIENGNFIVLFNRKSFVNWFFIFKILTLDDLALGVCAILARKQGESR